MLSNSPYTDSAIDSFVNVMICECKPQIFEIYNNFLTI
jgi:hypothetical protein